MRLVGVLHNNSITIIHNNTPITHNAITTDNKRVNSILACALLLLLLSSPWLYLQTPPWIEHILNIRGN